MTSYLLVGPMLEPVALSEARTFLRVDDTAEDGFVSTLITAARLHIEGTTGRALISQSWRVVADSWPADGTIVLPVAPLISISSITTYDGEGVPTILALAQFQPETNTSPARIFLPPMIEGAGVLREHNGIEIDYVAGFGPAPSDIPQDLRHAILSLVGYWFEHRDAVIIAGSGSVVPTGFDRLLAAYRSVSL